jgi:hypothetical protein
MLTSANQPYTAGAVLGGTANVPPQEVGAIQSQIIILESRLQEVFANQELLEQRLIPASMPYPVCPPDPQCGNKENPRCQIEDAIFGANNILALLAERQRQTMKHLQF